MINAIKKNKVLICGGASLLSFLWCKAVSNEYDIYLTNNKNKTDYLKFPVVQVDMLSINSIVNAINENSIDIVINTIGLTNVELCESDPEKAFLLNSYVPRYIAKACNITQRKLIHISTDHFFKDQKIKHSEDDIVSLINIYAKSKFNGELEVLENLPSALICRTNFFGNGPPHKLSFSDWIIKSIISKEVITLHNDVFYTPISGYDLAHISHRLLDLNCFGIFNISSEKLLTKFQFGMILCKVLNFSTKYINSGKISSRQDLATRPTSMGLSNKKMSKILRISVRPITFQIKRLKFKI